MKKIPFDAVGFFKAYNIKYSTDHHHCSPGWVQIHCPFCPSSQSKNFHLGVDLSSGGVSCWRCGGHSLKDLIQVLLNCSLSEVYPVLDRFKGKKAYVKKGPLYIPPTELTLPPGTGPVNKSHLRFLRKKGFKDPERLVEDWGLLGTGPLGPYKFRIIIPFFYQGEMTSYTSRDITNKASLRYKVCPLEQEIKHIKNSLYGMDKVLGDTVVVVEGPTDVWKLGAGAVGTSGIKWTMAQASLLTSHFRRAVILYDNEPQAQKQAIKLAEHISWDIDVEVVCERGIKDPGSLSEKQGKILIEELLRG